MVNIRPISRLFVILPPFEPLLRATFTLNRVAAHCAASMMSAGSIAQNLIAVGRIVVRQASIMSRNLRSRPAPQPIGRCHRLAAILVATLYVLLCWTHSGTAFAQSNDTSDVIRTILMRGSAPDLDGQELDLPMLRAFYEQRAYAPAWTASDNADNDSRMLRSALSHADEDGLDPGQYHSGQAILAHAPETALTAAEYDILLTDGALQFARDLRTGRPALKTIDRDIELPRQSFDVLAALAAARLSNHIATFLTALAPPHPAYAHLKDALNRYRTIAAEGGWPILPARTASDFAKSGQNRDLLRRRLAYEDALVAPADDLGDSVKRFQARHGLDTDGRVGARTLQALNVPAAERVWEIIANMERWRWLPRAFEPRYVAINVADAQLDVVAADRIILSSRVIVGRPDNPTPLLRAVATGITVNPPWNVPEPIARKEILPKLLKDRRYLKAQDMILRDGPPGDPNGLHVKWRALPRGVMPYHVQQRPGPKNALGTIKLELPNRFDVYLHDTPAKTAFERNDRDISHGCVRVEQIFPLASYALTGDATAVSSLTGAIGVGTTQYIPLSEPLPIYFLYWTVFADSDGSAEFRPDIYGRDQRLIAVLSRGVHGERVTSIVTGCRVT